MAAVRGLLKGAIAMKVIEIVRREAAKPENQAKARQLAQKVGQEVNRRRGQRPPQAPKP
jgi:3-hydroxyacyl-CoA dehydrogenase